MKAVMLSIQPKWCELIASGKKTVEIRKTKPRVATPFKCYIYCTKPDTTNPNEFLEIRSMDGKHRKANGKVIGEFVCDEINQSFVGYDKQGCPSYWDILDGSCLTANELVCYGKWKTLYGWHISDLTIYDEPKELDEFRKPIDCHRGIARDDCIGCWDCELSRPPLSWCYVEELK